MPSPCPAAWSCAKIIRSALLVDEIRPFGAVGPLGPFSAGLSDTISSAVVPFVYAQLEVVSSAAAALRAVPFEAASVEAVPLEAGPLEAVSFEVVVSTMVPVAAPPFVIAPLDDSQFEVVPAEFVLELLMTEGFGVVFGRLMARPEGSSMRQAKAEKR